MKFTLLILGSLLLFLLFHIKVHKTLERLIVPSSENNEGKKSFKEDRRRFTRKNTTLRVKYKTSTENGIAWLKNISQGGACITFMNSSINRMPLNLEISIPYDTSPVFADTKTVWSRRGSVGISFDEIKKTDLDRIFQFIDNKNRLSKSSIA